MTWQGDASPAGSKTAAWYQMVNMGTRETHYALLTNDGVCDVKPIDGKSSQMAYWESQIKKRAVTRPSSSQNGT